MRWPLNFALLLSAVWLCPARAATALQIEQAVLGPWHYLLPMESDSSGHVSYQRFLSPPAAVEFGGGRIAVIVPGSTKIAEFKAGEFDDLPLPAFAWPLSLRVDRQGKLYCLMQRTDRLDLEGGPDERWIASWSNSTGWSDPILMPVPQADRIEFDTQNRLWALGPSPEVAVFADSRWDRYQYGNGKDPFAPFRLSAADNGDVILFSRSYLPGALIYRGGKFIAEPQIDTARLFQEQQRKDAALADDSDFERQTGYICHGDSPSGQKTVLRTKAFMLVSFGNEGLAWAGTEALRNTPGFDENYEWEKIDDVLAPPARDSGGALWVARDNPRRIIKIDKDGQREFPVPNLQSSAGHSVLDFDQLGRPWIHSGDAKSRADYLEDGALTTYDSEIQALRAESKAFKSGRIFPLNGRAVKTPGGAICILDDENLTICDAQAVHTFTAEQISPGCTKEVGVPKGSYNPFREGAPRFDNKGRIYTSILGKTFRYHEGRWQRVNISDRAWGSWAGASPYQPPEWEEEASTSTGPFETAVDNPDGPWIIFRLLHFYRLTPHGAREPLDRGLNPLASYPFWTGWYDSPGATPPRIDPMGRLWVSPLGAHAQYRVWMVLRKKS